MPKTIYTACDIENLAKQGILSLALGEDIVITDMAHEKAVQFGIKLVKAGTHSLSFPDGTELHSREQLAVQTKGHLLHFSPEDGENELRAAIIETGRLAYQSGLMISNDGNISARLPDGHIVITPSGVCKGRMGPENLLVIDIDGKLIKPAADPNLKPTSEQPLHLEVYRQRPDVRAVIHTHLIFANALVISKGTIRMDVMPEAAAEFGTIPVTGFSMPSSTQNADVIREFIRTHDVIMIRNHGCVVAGKDLDQALIRVERLEHISKTLTFAELLGEVNALPPEYLEKILQPAR